MRGFGYAEFDTINDLMEALSLDKEVTPVTPTWAIIMKPAFILCLVYMQYIIQILNKDYNSAGFG